MRESEYQNGIIKRLKREFKGCIVLKNDPTYIQGFPDLLVLYKNKWAVLEVKIDEKAHRQPNQEYYVNKADSMSFGSIIYPQNEEEVFYDLAQLFLS